mgnify:CR=1 FL=1|tara:strand:- start:1800 stop:2732 length:933 start_codon:yes stop_codon:yes gene_type:complete
MILKKPKFWDYNKPNIFAYILSPVAYLIKLINFFLKTSKPRKFRIKTICLGNIYVGGTGKTSLSIAINKILNQKNIKSCFIKKFYKNQIDEQKLLKNYGKLFLSKKRVEAVKQAENENFEIAILDDGLQDKSIDYDVKFVCFNNINWIGNGMTIPAGPLRESVNNLKIYKNIFLNGNLENIEKLKVEILKINPNINIHIGKYEPLNLNEFSKNDKYLIFSGIGNHQTFVKMIKNYGLNIFKDHEFPDHYKYTDKDINNILNEANDLNCKIITTEKDYLRINAEKKSLSNINFIKSELKIIDEKKLIECII